MAEVLSGAPSAGAAPVTGAAAPAPSATPAPPESANLADAAREVMAGGDPVEAAPDKAAEAKPAGTGEGTPEATGAEGEGTDLGDKGEAAGQEPDELAELDFADLPAARKEYLKRDPEMRASWYFQKDMERLGMTVPEAREFRKAFGTPESAQFALKRAVDYGAMERALNSDAPEAHLQFLDGLRTKFPKGADRFVQTIAEHIDAIDPKGALKRDSIRMDELLRDLPAETDFEKEAVAAVWELIEKKASLQSPTTRAAMDPERQELEGYRARERQRVAQERQQHRDATQEAANGEIKKWVSEAFAGAKARLEKRGIKDGLPAEVEKDIGAALFQATFDHLKGHGMFQEQFINARDSAATPEEGRAAALKVVEKWGRTFLRDLAETRLKPYTDGVLRANQRRIAHAQDISQLAEPGGTAAAAGKPVKVSDNMDLVEAARAFLR